MNIVIFTHSLLSDWNHGNAHFLRGISTELLARGHNLRSFEARDNWSLHNLRHDAGDAPLAALGAAYPSLFSGDVARQYDPDFDLDDALQGADLILVHEWNPPALVAQIGLRKPRGATLLFHDTHHRAATAPHEMSAFDLSRYDGVLAFGNVIRDLYLQNRWSRRAWTWHEAADARLFKPNEELEMKKWEVGEASPHSPFLIWIGNWGDGERTRELDEFLFAPVRELGLKARIHGVRYPDDAQAQLRAAGIEYAGWLPNFRAAGAFARARVTVHVPRGPYVKSLPGIPTIRPFEALACGIPLVSAPWSDCEELFRPDDFLWARDGAEMTRQLRRIRDDPAEARARAARGRQTVLQRHTCAHRVDELLRILGEI